MNEICPKREFFSPLDMQDCLVTHVIHGEKQVFPQTSTFFFANIQTLGVQSTLQQGSPAGVLLSHLVQTH